MSRLVLLAFILTGFTAQADLLDRVHLEDALRSRLEETVQIRDKNARVFTHFEYKSYKTELPGTNSLSDQEFSPSKLESSDITRVNVEVYTELKELPSDIRESLYKIIPIEKNKISISTKLVQAEAKAPELKPVEAKDLSQIAAQSIESLTKVLFGAIGGFMALVLGMTYFYSSRKMKEFKEQFNLLAKAISENSSYQAPPASAQQQALSAMSSGGNNAYLEHLPSAAAMEVFADCYWCEEDAYAHWMWKGLSAEQRSEVMHHLPFMKEYSLFFVSLAPQPRAFHEHPFYLKPSSCHQLSMEALRKVLEKDLSLWHQLSPLRQSHSGLNLEQKLAAIQSKASAVKDLKSLEASPARALKTQTNWGEVSAQDETALFENPNLVPETMRGNIRSLVWLAHKNNDSIQKTLSKFDARSLAAAWVGPDEVLKKLEENLPEKKLRLLQTYREKSPATRQSMIYEALVSEGLRDEAA